MTATVAGRPLTEEVSGGQSYLSVPEKTLTFGLGDATGIETLEIRWPDGSRETHAAIPRAGDFLLEQGKTPVRKR